MIKIKNGDLLQAKETFIAHRVNCCGKMGRGVALQIRMTYPDVFRRYEEYCNEHRIRELPGKVLLIPTSDGKVICNLFGQEGYGLDRQRTDYAALSKAFCSLRKIVPNDEAIAMPYLIGCGNGGGDWSIVQKMIDEIFQRHTVVLYRM